jgi:hypothetical protein
MRKSAVAVAFVASFAFLNVYFAWDSGLLEWVSPALFYSVNAGIIQTDVAIWRLTDLARLTSYAYVVTDVEVLALIVILVTSAYRLGKSKGRVAALLRATQAASFCLAIYGLESVMLNCSQLFNHVSDFQSSFDFVPWFTNADMFASAFAILAGASMLYYVRLRQSRAVSAANPAASRELGRFLILFLSGLLLVVGGLVAIYYGGTWRLSYSSALSLGAEGGSTRPAYFHYLFASYTKCAAQLKLVSTLMSNGSCNLESADLTYVPFLAAGGISILLAMLVLKPPASLTSRKSELLSPLGRFTFGRTLPPAEVNLIVLCVEGLLVAALLTSAVSHLGLFNIPASCLIPPYLQMGK